MKGLVKNYIDLLSIDKLREFGIKNDIYLNDSELNYLLNLVKNNFEDILKDENKYLKDLENNINPNEVMKIKELYYYYKNRYKGYLF